MHFILQSRILLFLSNTHICHTVIRSQRALRRGSFVVLIPIESHIYHKDLLQYLAYVLDANIHGYEIYKIMFAAKCLWGLGRQINQYPQCNLVSTSHLPAPSPLPSQNTHLTLFFCSQTCQILVSHCRDRTFYLKRKGWQEKKDMK